MNDDDNEHPPAASTHSESARLLPRGIRIDCVLQKLHEEEKRILFSSAPAFGNFVNGIFTAPTELSWPVPWA